MTDSLTKPLAPLPVPYSGDQLALLKRTICVGSTDDEFQLFVAVCQRTRLDPFARQIHAVKRRSKNKAGEYEDYMVIQTGIDGYRLIAERTGEMQGHEGPFWCGKDGQWRDVWLEDVPPHAAKVAIYRTGKLQPFTAVAHWQGYVQTTRDGAPASRWGHDPAGMLAKCAEALALRMAFPQELSGLYSDVEMGQADSPREAPRVPQPRRMSERGAESYKGCIIAVKKRESQAKKPFWVVETDEPQEYTTFDTKLAEVAASFAGTGEVLCLSFEARVVGDKTYLNLKGIEAVGAAE